MTQETKRCTKCGEEKPLSAFPLRRRGTKTYPNSHCKKCRNEYTRKRRAAYRAAHPKPVRRTKTTKRCACCGQEFPIEMMGTAKRYGKVYVGSYCPTCAQLKRKKSNEAYKARLRQRTAERRAANAPKEGHLRCVHCGQEKPIEEFCRDSSRATGYKNICSECSRKYHRELYNIRRKSKRGVFYDQNTGRLMDYRTSRIKIFWTGEMLSILRKYYPNSSNDEVSEMIVVCNRTLVKKARELGLCKSKEYLHGLHSRCGFLGAVAHNKLRNQQQNPTVIV